MFIGWQLNYQFVNIRTNTCHVLQWLLVGMTVCLAFCYNFKPCLILCRVLPHGWQWIGKRNSPMVFSENLATTESLLGRNEIRPLQFYITGSCDKHLASGISFLKFRFFLILWPLLKYVRKMLLSSIIFRHVTYNILHLSLRDTLSLLTHYKVFGVNWLFPSKASTHWTS